MCLGYLTPAPIDWLTGERQNRQHWVFCPLEKGGEVGQGNSYQHQNDYLALALWSSLGEQSFFSCITIIISKEDSHAVLGGTCWKFKTIDIQLIHGCIEANSWGSMFLLFGLSIFRICHAIGQHVNHFLEWSWRSAKSVLKRQSKHVTRIC